MSELADLIAAARDKAGAIAKLEDKLVPLVAEFAELKAAIVQAAEEVAEADPKGTRRAELVTESGTAKVTWPVATLKLTEDNFAEAKKLAGPAWAKLAEKIPVTHKLLKAARDLIPALLPKAAAENLLAMLAGEPAAPRVTFA